MNEPINNSSSPKNKILLIVIVIVFIVLTVVFAALYILKSKSYTNLNNKYQSLSSTTTPIKKDVTVETLQKENADLKKAQTTAESALAEEKASEAKALQYNDIIGLLSNLIIQRGKITEFTEADFEQTKVLVEKTGDTELINLLVEKWNDQSVDPAINVFTVIKYIQEKITSNID